MHSTQKYYVPHLVLALILSATPALLWANGSCSNSHNFRSFEELASELSQGPKRRELSVDLQISMPDGMFPPDKMNEVRAWFAATKNLETSIRFQSDQTLRISVAGRAQRIESLLEALGEVFPPGKIQWRQEGPEPVEQTAPATPPTEQVAQAAVRPQRVSGFEEQPDIAGFPGIDVPIAPRVQPTAEPRPARPSRVEAEATTAPLVLDNPIPIQLKGSKRALMIDVRKLAPVLRRTEDLEDLKTFLETSMEWSIPMESNQQVFEIGYQPLHSRSVVQLRFSVETAGRKQIAIFEEPQTFDQSTEKQYWADVAKHKEIPRESFPFASSMMVEGKLRAAVSISGPVMVRVAIKSRLSVKDVGSIIGLIRNVVADQSPGVYYQIVQYGDRSYRVVIASDPLTHLKLISLFPIR